LRNPHDQSDAALLARQLAVMDHVVQFNLVEGAADYIFEDGKAPRTHPNRIRENDEAHAAGRDVIMEVDGVVIFRLPAWWG
jgi:hypothetical protein